MTKVILKIKSMNMQNLEDNYSKKLKRDQSINHNSMKITSNSRNKKDDNRKKSRENNLIRNKNKKLIIKRSNRLGKEYVLLNILV